MRKNLNVLIKERVQLQLQNLLCLFIFFSIRLRLCFLKTSNNILVNITCFQKQSSGDVL